MVIYFKYQLKRIKISSKSSIIFLSIFFLILKIFASSYLIEINKSIYELSFGFGNLIKNLVENGEFRSCFKEKCQYASRMPIIPLLIATLSHISKSQFIIAIIKNIFLSLFFIMNYLIIIKISLIDKKFVNKLFLVSLIVLSFSLPLIKHSSSITYEEGYLIEPIILWLISFLTALRLILIYKNKSASYKIILTTSLLGLLIFLIKSSMLLIFILSLSLVAFSFWKFYKNKGQKIYPLASIIICIVTLSAWGIHQLNKTGKFSIMTSYDGENFFRGNNDVSYKIYPHYSLDLIFNTQKISIKNELITSEILFPDFSKFTNEVEWNKYYKKMSKEWIINNPKKFFNFFIKKINNFYLSYKKTPYSIYENENQENNIKRIDKIFTAVWLIEGRIFLLATILLIIKRYMNNDKFMKIQSIIIILILLAYSIPYLIGFNYERHITPFLLIVIICFFSLTTISQKK